MKKWIAIILALIMAIGCFFCLSACGEDTPEKQLAKTQAALDRQKKAAEDAQKEYDDLQDKIEAYNRAIEELEKYD